MNNTLKLFKIAMLTAFRGDISKKKGRKFSKPLLFLLIGISFLPIVSGLVILSKGMYQALAAINQGNVIIALSFMAGSVVVLVFGMFYTISSYYMAKDIPNFLHLPLKPEEIIVSRFLTTLMYEYLTLLIFVVPVIIGCGIGGGFSIWFYLISFVIFIFLPILPLSVASIIIIALMSFSRKAVNKDRFTLISSLLGLAIGLGINFSLQSVFSSVDDPEIIQQLIASGQFDMIENMTSYFPGIKNASYAVINYDIVQLLIFLAIAVFSFICFIFVAKKLYFKGVLGISQQAAKRDFDIANTKFDKSRNSLVAYTIKELKLIFRTPIYFMNLALMDYLMPAIFIIAIVSAGGTENLLGMLRDAVSNSTSYGIVIAITFAFFIFVSSMNGITATCISREGDQLYIMKFLPMSIKDQIKAKLLSGLVVSLSGMMFVLLIMAIILKINIWIVLVMLLTGANAVFLTRILGLYIDLNHPKLNWENEVKAVKQNMNLVFNMLIGMVIAAIVIVASIVLGISILLAITIYIFGFAFVNYGLYKIISSKADGLIMRTE